MSAPTAVGDRRVPVVGPWRLWSTALGGLVAWTVRLFASASLVGWACEAGPVGVVVLYAISAAALAATGWALWASRRLHRRAGRGAGDTGWREAGFVARVGVALNAISAVLIVAETSFVPFVDPCTAL